MIWIINHRILLLPSFSCFIWGIIERKLNLSNIIVYQRYIILVFFMARAFLLFIYFIIALQLIFIDIALFL
jgi:hypothetical protein